MFVFGIDIPLVEIILILAVIIVLILVLFIYLAVKLIEMNRRMDKFSEEEKREFRMVKTLSKELMETNKSEVKELILLKDLRTDIHELVRGGSHTVNKLAREEKKHRRKNQHKKAAKSSKRKQEVSRKHKDLVKLLGRVDGFLSSTTNKKKNKKKGKSRISKLFSKNKKAVKRKVAKRKAVKRKTVKRKIVKRKAAKQRAVKKKTAKKSRRTKSKSRRGKR